MIGSFILAVVLFAAASLGWGIVFHSEKNGLSGKVKVAVYFLTMVSSVLSSVFLLKGFVDSGIPVGQVISSLVFALAFVLSLLGGFALTAAGRMAGVFGLVEGIWKSEEREKGRADTVGEIIRQITETGEIDPIEKELIGSILKFKDKIVHEVMIPRTDIVAIDVEEDPHRVLRRVAEEGYSRMPVYRGSIDDIVGIIYAKDLITMAEGSGAIVLQDILRSPYYVPESKKISQLLREMQRNKVHLAIVVDEFGGTEGIVTLEDVLEEIVGEIQDEYDESLSELTRDEDGDVHFSGSMSVDRFNELLESDIPREEDYDTMAGFVQKLAGKLPQKGEVYNHGEIFFIIEDVARHRIKKLKASLKEHPRHDKLNGEKVAESLSENEGALPVTHASQAGESELHRSRSKKAPARSRTSRKSPRSGQRNTHSGTGKGTRKKR